jgi:cytidine deaminase
MQTLPITAEDQRLIEAARDVLRRNFRPARHTVGAAVLTGSGKIYTGVNVEACGYGPCAEPIAVGAAFSNGETRIVAIVAVRRRGQEYPVLSPCGNCRQLVVDYNPEAMVIYSDNGAVCKAAARDLLPGAYISNFDDI